MSTSTPIIYKYPLDLTGVNPNNLIIGEPHTLPAGQNRAIVPNYGAFYSEHLVVRETNTGKTLVPNDQYVAAQLYQEATDKVDQEICTIVVVTDTNVDSEIEIDYQVIGGDYSYSVLALRRMIDTIDIDGRAVNWGDVLGKPEEFPPAPHLHDVGDTYGHEYLVEALEKVYFGLLVGDERDHDEIRETLQETKDQLLAEIQAVAEDLQDHIDDKEDPHEVTKAQVGLGLVENFPVASLEEALEGLRKDRYMTPWLVGKVLIQHSESDDHDRRYWTKDEADERYVNEDENVNITLEGPKTIYQGEPTQLRITNFDSFSEYTEAIEYGSISRDDEYVNLLLSVNIEVNPTVDVTLHRDGIPRMVTLDVVSSGIMPPKFIEPEGPLIPLDPKITLDQFETIPVESDEHTSTSYVIARDEALTDVIWEKWDSDFLYDEDTYDDIGILPPDTDLFFAAQFKGKIYDPSEWTIRQFRTVNAYIVKPIITFDGESNNRIPVSPKLYTAAFNSIAYDDAHAHTDWRIRDEDGNVYWDSMDDTTNLEVINPSDLLLEQGKRYIIDAQHVGAELGESGYRSLVIDAQLVNRPVIQSPVDGDLGITRTPLLQSSAYDGDGTHAKTRYQIATDSGFTNVVYDSGELGGVEQHRVANKLQADTLYYVRVYYESDTAGRSEWSPVVSFRSARVRISQRVTSFDTTFDTTHDTTWQYTTLWTSEVPHQRTTQRDYTTYWTTSRTTSYTTYWSVTTNYTVGRTTTKSTYKTRTTSYQVTTRWTTSWSGSTSYYDNWTTSYYSWEPQ